MLSFTATASLIELTDLAAAGFQAVVDADSLDIAGYHCLAFLVAFGLARKCPESRLAPLRPACFLETCNQTALSMNQTSQNQETRPEKEKQARVGTC